MNDSGNSYLIKRTPTFANARFIQSNQVYFDNCAVRIAIK